MPTRELKLHKIEKLKIHCSDKVIKNIFFFCHKIKRTEKGKGIEFVEFTKKPATEYSMKSKSITKTLIKHHPPIHSKHTINILGPYY